MQCDGYAAYKSIADAACGEAITLAFCWAVLSGAIFSLAHSRWSVSAMPLHITRGNWYGAKAPTAQ